MSENAELTKSGVLEELCNLNGVSGYESIVSNYILTLLKDFRLDELFVDKVGNVVCLRKGTVSSRKIMFIAHIDEVGFQVLRKKSDAQYQVKPIGNIKTWNAVNQRVTSRTASGTLYPCDEDNIKAHNYENIVLYCDSESEIKVGDVFSFEGNFKETNQYYQGKALDNRVSCYCLCELIKKEIQTEADIYFVFSVQEEIGMRGCRVAKTSITPDICISVDVSPECINSSLTVGKGVGLKYSDSIGVSDVDTISWIETICKNQEIDYQIEVSDCGTSELIITNELDFGDREVGVSIPCRYMHSSNTIVHKNDLENCIQLISNMLEKF